jgi:hypothetical protein
MDTPENTNGSWQKYDNGSWSSVSKPAGPAGQPAAQNAQQKRAAGTQTSNPPAAGSRSQSTQQGRPNGTQATNSVSAQPRAQAAQQQRPTATPPARSPATPQIAQGYQPQRPTPVAANRPGGNAPQSPGGGVNRPGGQASFGDLNQQMQSRQRGAAESQRNMQNARGGAGGFRR